LNVVFIFILIFAIIYAILQYAKPFGKDMNGMHGLIAISISFILIISKIALALINFFTSWFVVLFLFIFFCLFALRMFGFGEKDTLSLIKDSQFFPYIIVLVMIILIAGLATVFGQSLLDKQDGTISEDSTDVDNTLDTDSDTVELGGSTQTDSFGSNVLHTLVHPKVLGFLAMLFIGMMTLALMTST